MFLWLIFILFIAEIIKIAFFEKEKPAKYKQIPTGHKHYRADHIGAKLRWK